MSRLSIFAALAVSALAGCGIQDAPDATEKQGAKLSLDYFANTDVIGFRFDVVQLTDASCDPYATKDVALEGGHQQSFDVDLVDGLFPGGIAELVNAPFKNESRHIGADLFLALHAGCYSITATPVQAFEPVPSFGDDADNAINSLFEDPWEFSGFDINRVENDGPFWPSEDCSTTTGKVTVTDGQTSDLLLLSQCVNDPIGAVDALVLLNHPPEILVWVDEKFAYECEAVHVCALVKDPDDDPIRTEIKLTSGDPWGVVGDPWLTDPKVIGFSSGARDWISCATLLTDTRGDYEWQITAWDLGMDNGYTRDIEDLIDANQGLPAGTTVSHDDQTFRTFTAFYEQPNCIDDKGDIVSAPGVDVDIEKDCYASTNPAWYYCEDTYAAPEILEIRPFICDGNKLIEENLYPECDQEWLGNPLD